MINKLTYRRIYKLLKEGDFSNKKKDEEIRYLFKKNYIDNGFQPRVTDKGKIFLNDYENLGRKIEYFFKDYEFLGSLTVGFMGGLIGGNVDKIIVLIKILGEKL